MTRTSLLRIAYILAAACTSAFSLTAQDRFAVFPQIAVGGGFSSDIWISNQGTSSATGVKLDIFGDDGNPLTVQTDQGEISALTFDLAPGAGLLIRATLESDTALPGYCVVRFDEALSIRGTVVIRSGTADETGAQVGVSQQFPGTDFTFPVDIDLDRGVDTGLALANGNFQVPNTPAPDEQSFVIDLFDLAGAPAGRARLSLPTNQHTSLFLTDDRLFPELSLFQGRASVSAGVDYGLVALQLDGQTLSSLSIDSGPLLGALDFSAGVTMSAEVEPNDSVASAQSLTLPSRIAGALGTFADTDLFQFEAQQGDLVTAYTSTPPTSRLDSYLTLEWPDGTLISYSDQSGLLRTNDSFIRMVISEPGTYILRVEDFFFGGGVDYDYELLVQLESP